MKPLKKIPALCMAILTVMLPIALAEEINPQPHAGNYQFEAGIPSITNRQNITITGFTNPGVAIEVLVDSQRKATTQSDDEGSFALAGIPLGSEGIHPLTLRIIDDSGATLFSQDYDVAVDTTPPELSELIAPAMVLERTVALSGTVSENATINLYAMKGRKDSVSPPKVAGLSIVRVDRNLIQLSWEAMDVNDFGAYLVYRSDIGIIDIIKNPRSVNFPDIGVDSNATYTYRIAAVDTSGNIGILSDALAAVTLPGGHANRPKPENREIAEIEEPILTFTAGQGNFTAEFTVQDDSTYTITVEAIDSAGNGAREDLLVGVDTLAPTITITNPRPGTSMLDQFADNVDVRGKTEGNARVFLYLARTPYGLLNDSFDVSGFPEEIQALTESQMQADCNIQIASSTLCGTHADYEVRADSAGNFEFDGIDFSTTAAGVLRLQQVGFDELNRFTEEEEGRRAQLLFIASDAAGRKGAAKAEYRITTCWSGNYTYDVQQLIEFQSPTMLSTERLAEGTESIYFYLQLSAAGVESEYEVSSVTLTPACDRVMMEDPRFEFSCRIMRQSCAGVPNEDRTTWYFSCPLSRFDNLAEFTDAGEWEDWFDAIKGEMIFPYKVRLGYEVTSPDGSKAREYQTSCESIAYPVDKARIDFSTLLPDWLLYDGVDVLDRSVDGLSTALDQVELVLEWVGIGCVSTFAIKFIATFVRKYRCSMEGWKDTIKDKLGNSDATKDKACPATEEAQNKLTNEQLKTQCEDCAKAWEWEESLYKTYRYLCDRVFCHTAPTAQTQTLSEAQILAMVDNEIAYTCSEAGYDVRGQPLRRVQCTKLRDKYTVLNEKTIPYDEECVEVAVRKSDGSIQSYVQRLAKNQPLVTDGIVKFELYEERPGTGVYAVKESDTRFITNAANTCAEVCEDAGYGAVTESAQCLTVQQCANIKEKGERESANYGFTSDCPNIGANRDTAARDQMGKDINKRTECCCTKPAEQDKNAGKYYTAYDKVDSVELFTAVERQKVKEKDTNKELPEFFYRYYKTRIKTDDGHELYNPNQYYPGRDAAACFGQQSVWFQKDKVMHDPFKSHVSAFQCVCLSGIYNRIQALRNILASMRACLIEVRESGTADAGVCRELFSQYVCSTMWSLISYVRSNGCYAGAAGPNLIDSENAVAAGFSRGLDAVWGAVGDAQSELTSEYGNAELTNLIGLSEESIARKICLGAFGYDWEITPQALVDAAYSAPFATLVQALGPKREYLTFNPRSGQATYDYTSSWYINPGCDFRNYDIYLSCVGRKQMDEPGVNCDKQDDPEGSNCDCQFLEDEQLLRFYDGSSLTQNVPEDRGRESVPQRVITSPYRYDHLKFVLRPSREIRRLGQEAQCFPYEHYDAELGQGFFYFPIKDATLDDIPYCGFDVTREGESVDAGSDGKFYCGQSEIFWGMRPEAYFIPGTIKINSQDPQARGTRGIAVTEGEKIRIDYSIWKAEGPDLCLHASLDNGEKERFVPLVIEGSYNYPTLELEGANLLSSIHRVVASSSNSGALFINTAELTQAFEGSGTIALQFSEESGEKDGVINLLKGSTDLMTIEGTLVLIGDIKSADAEKASTDPPVVRNEDRLLVNIRGVQFYITKAELPKDAAGNYQSSGTYAVVYESNPVKVRSRTLTLTIVRAHDDKEIVEDPATDCLPTSVVQYLGTDQRQSFQIDIRQQGESSAATGTE